MSFFQAIQARKMCFTIFQNKKTPFQPIKITLSKSRKIEIFPKRLTHRFGQKMPVFFMSFFQAMQARTMCFKIFQKKKGCRAYKNNRFKKSKKCDLSKGVNPWFWSKNCHFSLSFFFRQYRPGKCVLQSSRKKKRLSSQ